MVAVEQAALIGQHLFQLPLSLVYQMVLETFVSQI